jgi:hypothetical protein
MNRKTKRKTSTKSQNHPYAKPVNEPSKRTSHTFALQGITPKLRFTAASHHGHCEERAKGKEKPLIHPAPVPLENRPFESFAVAAGQTSIRVEQRKYIIVCARPLPYVPVDRSTS